MRKIFKLILAVIVIVIAIAVLLAGAVFMDFAAYTATNSETLTPEGTPTGTALVVYDPGLSGAAKTVASKVASELQTQGYAVDLAGIKSGTAANTSGYSVIVAGGPIYAGAPTSSVKDFLGNLNHAPSTRIGVFGSGSGAQEQSDIDQIKSAIATLPNADSLASAVVVKIGSGENLDARVQDFVTQLLQ